MRLYLSNGFYIVSVQCNKVVTKIETNGHNQSAVKKLRFNYQSSRHTLFKIFDIEAVCEACEQKFSTMEDGAIS